MSTEHTHHHHQDLENPIHNDVAFEARDVKTSAIFKFLAWLLVSIVASYFLVTAVYNGLTHYYQNSYQPPPPSREGMTATMPPEPRLQGMPGHLIDPQQDWRNMVKSGDAANNELKWIDEKAGVAQIPVKDAMNLILEKGLPALPPAPAEKK